LFIQIYNEKTSEKIRPVATTRLLDLVSDRLTISCNDNSLEVQNKDV